VQVIGPTDKWFHFSKKLPRGVTVGALIFAVICGLSLELLKCGNGNYCLHKQRKFLF
jgi:hypothetical protein